jgi:hypothetical protein
MKQLIGCVAAVGLLATATAANAQVPLPLRIGGALVTTASDVVGGTISTVSDFGGPYAAMPPEMGPRDGYAPLLPPREVYAILRENGFSPLGAPQQRGIVYTISAIDRDGDDGRLVIDARDGRIVRFMPAYRMGSRMGEEVVTTYGPSYDQSYGPRGALPPMRDDRAMPRPPAAVPRLASRTPTVPLPKAPPMRAVAAPKAVAAPAPVRPVPVQQSAVTPPKTDEVRVIPLTPAAPAAAPPTVAAPAVEAKPASPPQPTETMPPAQGLE